MIATFFRWCVAFAKKERGCGLSPKLKYSQQGSENNTVTIDGHSPYESDWTNVIKRHFLTSNSAYNQACLYCYICVVCVYGCTNVLCCPLHHQTWWVNEFFLFFTCQIKDWIISRCHFKELSSGFVRNGHNTVCMNTSIALWGLYGGNKYNPQRYPDRSISSINCKMSRAA